MYCSVLTYVQNEITSFLISAVIFDYGNVTIFNITNPSHDYIDIDKCKYEYIIHEYIICTNIRSTSTSFVENLHYTSIIL